MPGPAPLEEPSPRIYIHKDEECLFFLIDFLQINPGTAERGSPAGAVYLVFMIKRLLHSNRWQCASLQEMQRGASATSFIYLFIYVRIYLEIIYIYMHTQAFRHAKKHKAEDFSLARRPRCDRTYDSASRCRYIKFTQRGNRDSWGTMHGSRHLHPCVGR